jgi:hypothetical protein
MMSGPFRATTGGGNPSLPSSPGRATHAAEQRGQRTRLAISSPIPAGGSVKVLHFGQRIP